MNSIGERIYELRKKNNMSQGDLADKLDVSRQTVSKWENNSSIPEVEKISQLSQIFSVTTDYIIKGTAKETEQKSEEIVPFPAPVQKKLTGRTVAGIVLIVLGAVVFVAFCFNLKMLSLIGVWLIGIGVLLILCKKHTRLLISWLSFILGERFCFYFTSVNMKSVFLDYYYSDQLMLQLIFAYVLWIIAAVLIVCTLVAISKGRKKQSK